MAVTRPLQVGWDVERADRIQIKTVERVCSAEEVAAAPEVGFLWCAKEAFFKALEDEQPLILSALTITGWEAVGVSMWRWQGLGPRNTSGILLHEAPWLLAGAVIL
jgi:hypothetical protein